MRALMVATTLNLRAAVIVVNVGVQFRLLSGFYS